MKIIKSADRIVVVLPSWGIAVKFSRVHFTNALKGFFTYPFVLSFSYWVQWVFGWGVDQHGSLHHFLFRGIKRNWDEYLFYRRTKHGFVQPTYLSLFGLFNIQKYGPVCQIKDAEFWRQLLDITKIDWVHGGSAMFREIHHFSSSDNFVLEDGKLRMCDYGNKLVQEAIMEFGQKIQDEFDPNYRCPDRSETI